MFQNNFRWDIIAGPHLWLNAKIPDCFHLQKIVNSNNLFFGKIFTLIETFLKNLLTMYVHNYMVLHDYLAGKSRDIDVCSKYKMSILDY